MKNVNLFLLLVMVSFGYAQVGINTDVPNSTLDVHGKNHNGALTSQDGIVVPRVNSIPVNGQENAQLVYLIQDDTANGYLKGFHYWDAANTQWLPLDTTKEPWKNASNGNAADSNTQNIYQLGNVGINTNDPKSTLDVNGTMNVKVKAYNGGPSGLATSITDGVYLNLNPAFGSNEFYLPAASEVPGRIYYMRNVSNTETAIIYTSGSSLFMPNNGFNGSSSITLENNAFPKTIFIIFDGLNWTVFN